MKINATTGRTWLGSLEHQARRAEPDGTRSRRSQLPEGIDKLVDVLVGVGGGDLAAESGVAFGDDAVIFNARGDRNECHWCGLWSVLFKERAFPPDFAVAQAQYASLHDVRPAQA